jgi:predicted nucleotidyltransferase
MKRDRKKHIIKRVMRSGNAGSVYVPRDWIDQMVMIRLFSVNGMVLEALSPYLENIVGIYLYGVHARGEEAHDSDVDVLVITNKRIPLGKVEGMNITVLKVDEIENYVRLNPVEFHSMIRDAVPIINESLLEEMKNFELGEEHRKGYYEDVRKSLSFAREMELEGDLEAVVYSLMLRLKGMYLLQSRDKEYSRKELEDFIEEKGMNRDRFRRLYGVYRAKRDDRKVDYEISQADVRKLYKITDRVLEEGTG